MKHSPLKSGGYKELVQGHAFEWAVEPKGT